MKFIKLKQFLGFVGKEFRHILRDRRTMLIVIGIPIVQIILFGFAISTEVNNVRVAFLTPTTDNSTRLVTERISANSYFRSVGQATTTEEIETMFRRDKVDLAVVFEPDFGRNMVENGVAKVQLIADGTDPNIATMFTSYAVNIIADCQRELQSTPTKPQYIITPTVKMLYNPQLKSSYNFVPGVMGLILMLICAMMTAVSIVREKETGTMEVLLVSPMKPILIIIAKAVPYLVLSGINLSTILLLSVFVLGVPVAGSLFWLGMVSLVFIFVALALGLLISTVSDTQVGAMIMSGMGLMMPTTVLSGMMFPVESMPLFLQWVSALMPARWYIAAVRKIMIEGLGISYALEEVVILSVMAIVLIVVSLRKFKYRLE